MESDTERIHEQNYIDPSLTGVVRYTLLPLSLKKDIHMVRRVYVRYQTIIDTNNKIMTVQLKLIVSSSRSGNVTFKMLKSRCKSVDLSLSALDDPDDGLISSYKVKLNF